MERFFIHLGLVCAVKAMLDVCFLESLRGNQLALDASRAFVSLVMAASSGAA